MATIDKLTNDQVAGYFGPMESIGPVKINEIIDQLNTNTAALAGASDPFNFAGTVALPADFPAAPDVGDAYVVTADVIDNDPTKTNTGDNFLAGDVVIWDGTAWQDNDVDETGIAVVSATPYTVPDGVHTVLVDTATIAGPSVVNLPEALPKRVGRRVLVKDYTSGAESFPIAVTPQGADEIDNVAAAKSIDTNDGALELQIVGTGKIITDPSSADLAAHEAIEDLAHGWVASAPVTVDLKSVGANAIPLPGTAAQRFAPIMAILRVATDGGLNGDAQFSFGTTAGGAEVLPVTPITLAGADTTHQVLLSGGFPAIAGDSDLDVSVTAADTGVSGTAQVSFLGRML